MADFFQWLGRLENSKIVALLIFFVTFCAILLYVFTGKKRRARLESYKYIPFADEDNSEAADKRKVDER
ncbi:MAG: cbb3-type cytochrome oxidase subunit 3 [Gammaproteobacteria bacterium]